MDQLTIRVRLRLIEKAGSEAPVFRTLYDDPSSEDEEPDDGKDGQHAPDAARGKSDAAGARRPRSKERSLEDRAMEVEDRTFNWQQRVFSPAEIAKYANMTSPSSGLENLYASEIRRARPASADGAAAAAPLLPPEKTGRNLFTYVDKDNYDVVAQMDALKIPTTSSDGERKDGSGIPIHRLAEHGGSGGAGGGSGAGRGSGSAAGTGAIAGGASAATGSHGGDKFAQGGRPQHMFLMAHIAFTDEDMQRIDTIKGPLLPGQSRLSYQDVLLCRIRDNQDGSFFARPGVQSQNGAQTEPWYRFAVETGDVYEYYICIANERPRNHEETDVDLLRMRALQQLAERALSLRSNLIPKDFARTPEFLKLHVFGEVVDAAHFDNARWLYIRYILDVDAGHSWDVMGASGTAGSDPFGQAHPVLSATTHMCRQRSNMYKFNFPFELHGSARRKEAVIWPRLLIEVSSVDFLNRHRVEGYGHVPIPLMAGPSLDTIRAWRPEGSLRNRMKSYLLGGSTDLRDVRYTAIASSETEADALDRAGLVTVPSGVVRVRMHVVFHLPESDWDDALFGNAGSAAGAGAGVGGSYHQLQVAARSSGSMSPDQVANSFKKRRRKPASSAERRSSKKDD